MQWDSKEKETHMLPNHLVEVAQTLSNGLAAQELRLNLLLSLTSVYSGHSKEEIKQNIDDAMREHGKADLADTSWDVAATIEAATERLEEVV
jgi:hypothetical protein